MFQCRYLNRSVGHKAAMFIISLGMICVIPSMALSAPANDNLANAKAISLTGSAGEVTGSNMDATAEVTETDLIGFGGKSVWWTWTSPGKCIVKLSTRGSDFNTILAVYTGTAISNLTEVASNDDEGGNGATTSALTFLSDPGVKYYIAVDGYAGAAGNIILNWGFVFNNDNFASAIQLTGASGTVTGSNEYASSETNEPDHAGSYAYMSVWWKWKPSTTGYYTFDTAGSNFDTVLAVYKGTAISNLTEVASNNDGGNISPAGRVTFLAQSNTTYYIVVDGSDAEHFDITLNWRAATPPANDNLANAASLTGAGGRATGSNVDASGEANEPDHAGSLASMSVWWKWTPLITAYYSFDTAGSNFDTVLAVYTGSAIDNLTEIASNNDGGSANRNSVVKFHAQSGTGYYISVDGYGGEAGDIILNWKDVASGFPGDFDNDGFITLADAIIGLNVIVCIPPGVSRDISVGDVSGDKKIGLPEVIYILQIIGGLR